MADKSQGISKITVKGFKSLYDETSVEIRPLTILAGANSSGKSSIMQPLLLMKQTLEATYTPKVFKLDGPNVVYTNPKQFFHIDKPETEFSISLKIDDLGHLSSNYLLTPEGELQVNETSFITTPELGFKSKTGKIYSELSLQNGLSHEEIASQVPQEYEDLKFTLQDLTVGGEIKYKVGQIRYLLTIEMIYLDGMQAMEGDPLPLAFFPINRFFYHVRNIIHVSGLRDHPSRSYPIAQIDGHFEGKFNNYFASVIDDWGEQEWKNSSPIIKLVQNMRELRLSSGLKTHTENNEISIEVPHPTSKNGVSIADVGLGVSQVLPVLVALLVAKEGQLVYLEQPELHLHPRAQVKLAQIIADASNRGVRVVVETHSSLLLIGIQTLIAEGKLKPEDTILHWFKRGEDGKTTVDSQTPDENGAYGDWPEDFADVELQAQSRYLNAVDERLFGQPE